MNAEQRAQARAEIADHQFDASSPKDQRSAFIMLHGFEVAATVDARLNHSAVVVTPKKHKPSASTKPKKTQRKRARKGKPLVGHDLHGHH